MPIELNKIVLSRYIISKHLASGGMADIYEAKDIIYDKPVALKILKEKSLNNDYELELFKNEARFTAMFNHPHIMQIYNVGNYDNIPFVSYELLKGKTLKEVLDNRSKLSSDEALDYMSQILDAIMHMHERRVLHNDLKPDNILLLRDGNIKLCDLGIASHFNEKIDKELMGTVSYLAPEVLQSKKYTEQSDVYSLGIIFFELLTGKLPFYGNNSKEILQAHIKENVPSISKYVSLNNYKDFDFVIEKAVSKSLTSRYKSAAEFNADIQKLRKGESLKKKNIFARLFK